MPAIVVNALSKSYSKHGALAVDSISFDVQEGELFGLIGADGAGKTTVFRMLTTLLLPNSGSATVAGFDIVRDYYAIRRQVGYMPGRFSLYPDLSVSENIHFFATLFDTSVEENYELIKDIYEQLARFKDRRAGQLSGGMKQKLALCCALIHKPKILFLDEPTTGVDPVSRKEFWEMLKRLKMSGITILVSTPYMDEASMCDRIALIQNGTLLSIDTPQNIVAKFPNKLYAIRARELPRLLKSLHTYAGIQSAYAFGDSVHVTFIKGEGPGETVADFLQKQGNLEVHMAAIAPTVEDCFIQLLKG